MSSVGRSVTARYYHQALPCSFKSEDLNAIFSSLQTCELTIHDSRLTISTPLNDRGIYNRHSGYAYRILLLALKNRIHFDFAQ